MIENNPNIFVTDLPTAVIGANALKLDDWNKLWNYVYDKNFVGMLPKENFYTTENNEDFPECALYIQPHNFPYAVHVSLNPRIDKDLERELDEPMHAYVQWLGFSSHFADIIVYLRRKEFCALIVDRDY